MGHLAGLLRASQGRLTWSAGLASCLSLFLTMGCNSSATPGATSTAVAVQKPLSRGAGPLQIVATTGMVADLVRQVVGDRGVVTSLMGPGADPHLYKPVRNDVRRMLDADVIVSSGLFLEHRLQETIEHVGQSGKPTVAVTDALDRSTLRPLSGSGYYDPHVWMNVDLWSQCVTGTAERFAEIDPAGAAEYRQRASEYCRQLADLDAYVRQVVDSIPEQQRVLVTAHDAFGYFSDRYQIPVQSVQGVSTESEAGVQDVNSLVDFLVTHKVPALFVESSVSPKSLQAVLEGCRSRGKDIRLGGELYSDAMGPADAYEGTYLGMLDANATRIARALGGTAPSRGWQGKLSRSE